ncbi:Gfo/Idh/MocA family protein [Fimbriiglobus ruber]|uniref:Myo-inositol 2-dehydrogenase n=1 Tax=Fimbriiglobus ruber TaxID=1908690 RepID=A0A225DFH3_9BACT|nr:Gfo/Idh/MocA family oxidoreductase [Fimbriiglobus ruber]OWK34837.1 Myo-inositol 2-dehydrogenase [Fimbriiglobus ruber]
MPRVTRRDFTKTATAVGVTAALSAGRVLGANDRIRIGFIGVGNRGDQVLDAFLEHKDAEVVAFSDLNQSYLEFAAKKAGGTPEFFHDYRKLLDRKDLDAVVIATPDHWHALQMISACRAGKDVYCEKPLSLCVAEGRAMVTAARETKRVVQVGIQRMSSDYCREAADIIKSGGIGKVTAVRAFHVQNEWPAGIGNPPDEEPPAGFDWDAWQGPAPKRPYNKNRTFYRFRWFYDYSGGQVTNFGVHYLAQIHRSLGVDAPLTVAAIGGKFANYDNREVPDTLEVVWHYPGDTLVTLSQFNATGSPGAARPCEVEFRGTLGTLYFRANGYEVVPDIITPNEFVARTPVDRAKERGYRTGAKTRIVGKSVEGKIRDADHARNFLDCVKSRKTPSCDVEYGHHCTTAALVANIALKTKAVLEWDAKAERFTNNNAANKLLSYEYRAPYRLPV